jgi:prepilin-type N-terminal cleavage/methylation domain-containing protein
MTHLMAALRHSEMVDRSRSFGLRCAERRFASREGFTFIELLATMVLIAIFMPTAMRGIGLCTQLAGQSRKQIEAASLAKTKLTELMADSSWDGRSESGDFGSDWPAYKWTADVSNWADGTDVGVRQLDLTVTWQSRGLPRTLVLSTLVYLEGQ